MKLTFALVESRLLVLAAGSLLAVASFAAARTAGDQHIYPDDARVDSSNRTTLMTAAMEGDVERARAAIARGSDIERTWQDRSPLMWATMRGHTEMVTLLLTSGARVNTTTRYGESPLYLAVSAGHPDLARLLVDHGAKLSGGPSDTVLALHAAEYDDPGGLALLSELGAPLDGTDENRARYTALHVAASRGNERVVTFLLDHGSAIEARTAQGWTPLHLACADGRSHTVELLLARGADLMAQDRKGRLPFHLAAELGRGTVLATIERSTKWKSDDSLRKATDLHGRRAEHLAAWAGNDECVQRTWWGGEREPCTARLHWTPAHLAALAGNIGLVRALQRYSPSSERDSVGRTPLDLLHAAMRATESESAVPVDGTLELPMWSAKTGTVVSWIEDAGFTTSRTGPRLLIWEDGVYVRVMPGELSAVVGQLPEGRLDQLMDELSETGLLDNPSFEQTFSEDDSTETFDIRVGAQVLHFTRGFWSPWIFGPYDLDEELRYVEWDRARAVLQIVHAEREDSVDRHLVQGRFRDVDLGLRSPR